MQKLFGFLATFLLFGQLSFAQDIQEKNFVKSFNPGGSENIVFKLPHHNIDQKPYDGEALLIELTVEANVPERIMMGLIKAGRYQIEGISADGNFVIDAPNLEKPVTVGGKPLEEKIIIAVKTPGAYAVNGNTLSKNMDGLAARSLTAEQLKEMKRIRHNIKVGEIKFVSTYKEEVSKDKKTSKTPSKDDLKTQYGEVLLDGEFLQME